MTPVVLIHGGGFDSRCWDLTIPRLAGPALAVDLPGRGRHPAALESVDLASCAESVVADIDDAGFEQVVLVGHSLAGCSMPAMIGLLGQRVRHAVFVACTVPEQGASAFDTLDAEVQALARGGGGVEQPGTPGTPRTMDLDMAKIVFGNDLSEDEFAWCVERLVPEAPKLTTGGVDLVPLRQPVSRTWVRTLQDVIVVPDKQLRFAGNVGDCPVVDIDAGHMVMISQPVALAEIIDAVAS